MVYIEFLGSTFYYVTASGGCDEVLVLRHVMIHGPPVTRTK